MTKTATIRFHPHYVGINQVVGEILEFSPPELLTWINQNELRLGSAEQITEANISFDLIHIIGESSTQECSEAFLKFVNASGFREIYSVMVGPPPISVGYADREGWPRCGGSQS